MNDNDTIDTNIGWRARVEQEENAEIFQTALTGKEEECFDDATTRAGEVLEATMVASRKAVTLRGHRSRSGFTCYLHDAEVPPRTTAWKIQSDVLKDTKFTLCGSCYDRVTKCTDSVSVALFKTDVGTSMTKLNKIDLPGKDNESIPCTHERAVQLHDWSHGGTCSRMACGTRSSCVIAAQSSSAGTSGAEVIDLTL